MMAQTIGWLTVSTDTVRLRKLDCAHSESIYAKGLIETRSCILSAPIPLMDCAEPERTSVTRSAFYWQTLSGVPGVIGRLPNAVASMRRSFAPCGLHLRLNRR